MADDMRNKNEEFWKKKLTPEQYHVLREKGTEYPGTGRLLHNDKTGEYRCAACDTVLFKSDSKYESTTPGLEGWPSFSEVAKSDAVELKDDSSYGMFRTEVICKTCGSHLGHLFDDSSHRQTSITASIPVPLNSTPKNKVGGLGDHLPL